MTKHPVALAIALALATSVPLSGCDRASSLTEQEHIQRAKDFEDKGNLKGSIIELKNVLQKNPGSVQARLLLGQIYLKAGMGAEAEKELSQAEKLGVNRESIKLQLGEALLLMGEYKRVLDEIQPGAQTSATNLARVLQLRADALFRQGKLNEACTMYQQSIDTHTNYPPTFWGLAQCAVAERDMKKAKVWLDSALKIKDKQATTWVYIGDWEKLNQNSPGALVAYSSALHLEPNNLEALQNRAILNLSIGQLQPARQDIEKINVLAPKSAGALYLEALLSFNQQKYADARDDLQNVFKVAPDHMPSVLLAGSTFYALGSYQQAESYLNRFLINYPAHAYARRILAATKIKQNQPDIALETLAPLLSPGTQDVQALALAGKAYLIKGESARASEFFDKAAAIDPKNASIHTQLGLIQLATGNAQLAITTLEAAAALDANQVQADSLLILAYLDRKQYDDALAAIDVMEKKTPSSAIPHNFRGNAYLGKHDLASARKSFEKALSIDPAFFPAAASLAQLDMRDKKPEAARKRFENVLAKNENDLQAMLALAQLAAIDKKEQVSIKWLEKAAKAHPNALRPRQLLVTYYLGKKEYQKASTYAREGLVNNPDNPVALDLLGTTQLAAGENENALATYKRLTEKAPGSAEAHYKLAQLLESAGNPEAARKSLSKALEIRPDFRLAADALMDMTVKAGNPDEALRIARQIQSTQPKSPFGLTREGDILAGMKRYKEAVKAYEKASLLGSNTPLMIKWHHAASLAGDSTSADTRLTQWLRAHPKDFAARSYLAQTYLHTGKNPEAITQYEELLRQAPQDIVSLNNLASLYQQQKDPRALPTAERAYKLAPQNPAVLDTLGWVLTNSGQPGRGLKLLQKAIAGAPAEASIRYHLAVAYAGSGDKAQAKKELEQLLKGTQKFPEHDAAQALLIKL